MAAKRRCWYDLHCHVLPGMDDGCKTPQESIALLKQDRAQGIYGVIATPHYYPRESIAHFLKRREAAAQRLWAQMRADGEERLPWLTFGAEAAYHAGLAYDDDLEKLCMGYSRYLLLEMPFSAWPPTVLRDVVTITEQGITPIIAHVERYLGYQTPQTAQQLFELDVLIQVNAGALDGVFKGRYARKLIREGKVDILSSDAHNVTSRPPNLGLTAEKFAAGSLGEDLELIRRKNREVFRAAIEGEPKQPQSGGKNTV